MNINLGDKTIGLSKLLVMAKAIELFETSEDLVKVHEQNFLKLVKIKSRFMNLKSKKDLNYSQQFELDKIDLPEEQNDLASKSLEKYTNININSKDDNGVGFTTKVTHKIELTNDTITKQKVRRFNPKYKQW